MPDVCGLRLGLRPAIQKGCVPAALLVELPGIETDALPGNMLSELPVRSVSVRLSTSHYLRFRFGS
jgi:hypothetical protein